MLAGLLSFNILLLLFTLGHLAEKIKATETA